MAKKSRRARKKNSRSVARAPVVRAAETAAAEVAAQPGADRQEYAYVVTDIRQVAILAIAIFALLVALSFFIG